MIDELEEMFYAKLNSIADQLSSRDILIVLGDFSAATRVMRAGYDLSFGPHGSGTSNVNSSLPLDSAKSRRLRIWGS